MTTATYDRMVIYKPGEMHIQDTMKLDENGVLRTACYGHTLASYIKEHGEGFVIMPFDEAIEQIRKAEEAAYIRPFTEISEEDYNEMLEVLPPQKWQTVDGVNIFRMSEYQTGNITGHYARFNGRFFAANRRTTTPYEDIAKEVKAI